ncbi:hypothetical protein V8C42DRAFT_322602 [Trichoderma barbatum]
MNMRLESICWLLLLSILQPGICNGRCFSHTIQGAASPSYPGSTLKVQGYNTSILLQLLVERRASRCLLTVYINYILSIG